MSRPIRPFVEAWMRTAPAIAGRRFTLQLDRYDALHDELTSLVADDGQVEARLKEAEGLLALFSGMGGAVTGSALYVEHVALKQHADRLLGPAQQLVHINWTPA